MTLAGYIADQRCPSNPEHGVCWDQQSGYFCPHVDHHANGTQFFWHFDEWERIKSLPTDTATPGTTKIIVRKTNRRRRRT